MNIKWMIWFGAILLVLAASPAFAWRCDRGLVDSGDNTGAVRTKCGKPDFIYDDTGVYRHGRFTSIDERWYYNSGPSQLLQELLFHNGVLQMIDTLGYGFNLSPHPCTPQDVRVGMSAYELASRCGKPKNKRVRFGRLSGSKRGRSGGAVVVRTEEWTYDFGSEYLLQKVSISGGQVQNLDTPSRHTRRSRLHG